MSIVTLAFATTTVHQTSSQRGVLDVLQQCGGAFIPSILLMMHHGVMDIQVQVPLTTFATKGTAGSVAL